MVGKKKVDGIVIKPKLRSVDRDNKKATRRSAFLGAPFYLFFSYRGTNTFSPLISRN